MNFRKKVDKEGEGVYNIDKQLKKSPIQAKRNCLKCTISLKTCDKHATSFGKIDCLVFEINQKTVKTAQWFWKSLP